MIRLFIALSVCCTLTFTNASSAQELRALARVDVAQSGITARASGDIDLRLKISQAVPYRIFALNDPPRVILDFREVNWDGVTAESLLHTELVTDIRFGLFRPGWSRMVLQLTQPMGIFEAEMMTSEVGGAAVVEARLTLVDGDALNGQPEQSENDIWALPPSMDATVAKTRQTGEGRVIVAIDPGHGGFDPGAQYSGLAESNLMLIVARELKEKLVLSGRYEVILTRYEDHFLSLEGRVSRAREAGADAFISLHADALASGRATGTTVYTLSEKASNDAAAQLAASHDRSDLLAGVEMVEQDDAVASVLMDMARLESAPRSEALAAHLVAGIGEAVGKIRRRPHLHAGFTVLRAPDIPSVLIELGFMSNSSDLNNLATPEWRAKVTDGILAALDRWSIEDAAIAQLLRK